MRRRLEKLIEFKNKRVEAKKKKKPLLVLYYTIRIKLWKIYAK